MFIARELFPAAAPGKEGFTRPWRFRGAAGGAQEPLGSVPAALWGFPGALGTAKPMGWERKIWNNQPRTQKMNRNEDFRQAVFILKQECLINLLWFHLNLFGGFSALFDGKHLMGYFNSIRMLWKCRFFPG